ncbi:MAG: hypothetical protein FWG11_08310 [Promicromonosporaceae bacterium]|nr:hypothetical protein [Promicromonosporaceae bacterium]
MSYIDEVETVTKRELNQNTASVLARVRPGHTIEVTERGVASWWITPEPPPAEDALERMARLGQIQRPTGDGTFRDLKPIPEWEHHTSEDIQELLEWARGDR